MSDMSNNELDDLFKRAAEQYPLQSAGADWDAVRRALDEEDDTALILPPDLRYGQPTRGIRWFWLLLLLIFGAIGYYTQSHQAEPSLKRLPEKQTLKQTQSVVSLEGTSQAMRDQKKPALPAGRPVMTGREKFPVTPGLDLPTASISRIKPGKVRTWQAAGPSGYNSPAAVRVAPGQGIEVQKPQHRPAGSSLVLPEPAGMSRDLLGRLPVGAIIKTSVAVVEYARLQSIGTHGFSCLDSLLLPNSKGQLFSPSGSAIITPVTPRSGAKNLQPLNSNKRFLYAGVMVSPDISTVKLQSLTGAGYTAGILLGYHLSPRWNLETGLYLDSKKYYSKGEYFSTKNVAFLNYVNLLKVNGTCNMLELPVNLRFNLTPHDHGSWFVTMGMSTYYMFRESYTYNYLYYGVDKQKSYAYHNTSQYWFSVLNFSAGYQHPINRKADLRMEPFLRIPLAGMGTGSLPIMSAGMNLGVVRRFN